MNIMQRCVSCRTPFSVRETEIVAALIEMKANEHKYHNALCPSCGKPNKISLAQMERAAPRQVESKKEKPAAKKSSPKLEKAAPTAKPKTTPTKSKKKP